MRELPPSLPAAFSTTILKGAFSCPSIHDSENFADRVNYAATAITQEGGLTEDVKKLGEIEVTKDGAEVVTLHFVPEAWVNDYAIVVDPGGECAWTVPRKFFLEKFSSEDDWNECHQVRDDMRFEGTAPAWVRAWTGPFQVELAYDPASVWPAFVEGESG